MKKVLIVDDSTTMRRMIVAALRAVKDVATEEATSGLGGIERLSLEPVDLVILDLNMPDVHGLEVLRFIRQQSRLRELPVIILTTRDDPESRAAASAEGATAYLTKPFQPGALATVVGRVVNANVVDTKARL